MGFADTLSQLFSVPVSRIEAISGEAKWLMDHVAHRTKGLNLWAVDPEERLALYCTTKLLEPKIAVETGVGPGVSTTFILGALNTGVLHSIDWGKKYGEESKSYPVGFVIPENLKQKWVLHTGDSKTTLKPLLDSLGNVDLFFHDSEHTYEHVLFELTSAWSHMKRGVMLVDNFDWTDAPNHFADEAGSKLFRLTGDLAVIPKLRR
jgi:predicted O-methyltransferase YrrM